MPCSYDAITTFSDRLNEFVFPQHHLIGSISDIIRKLRFKEKQVPLDVIQTTKEKINHIKLSHDSRIESKVIHSIIKFCDDNTNIFLGNSLSIRLMSNHKNEVFKHPKMIYANRGASGIDGLIATAAGVVESSKDRGILLIGDLSTLHDLNSLSLLQIFLTLC